MSAISLPSIWTPQSSRSHDANWWTDHLRGLRDRLALWTAGKRQKNSSGRWIKHRGNGKVGKNSSTSEVCNCVCGAPCLCSQCLDNHVPCGFTVTSTDIDYTSCNGVCIPDVVFGHTTLVIAGDGGSTGTQGTESHAIKFSNPSVNPNGVFTFTSGLQDAFWPNWACTELGLANPAFCIGPQPPGGSAHLFTDGGSGIAASNGGGYGPDGDFGFALGNSCTPSVSVSTAWNIYWGWILAKTPSHWYLAYLCSLNMDFSPYSLSFNNSFSNYYANLYQFYGSLSATSDCSTSLTFTNELPGCSAFDGIFDGTCGQTETEMASKSASLASGGTAIVDFFNS